MEHAHATAQAVSQSVSYLRYIPLFPLLGVLFNIFLGQRLGRKAINIVSPGVVLLSFFVSLQAFESLSAGGALVDDIWPWITSGNLHVDFALRVDQLSALMILIVTGVGFLIHVYSIGYMAHDEDVARYFAYLNLFTMSMLLLVLGENLLLLFVGWEGVGLCSYLLIGFWYTDDEKASAGKKAFIVNRVGDAGFLLGIFLLFWTLGEAGVWTSFSDIEQHISLLVTLLPSFACSSCWRCRKIAQIPLYVWLPDAGWSNPGQCWIHGDDGHGWIYMTPGSISCTTFTDRSSVVAYVASDRILAATIGLVQTDIKKVSRTHCQSTGYMFLVPA
jgi:NADH-quinone oxidoreductase subunit L